MTQAENLINLYETGFKICLVLAVLCFDGFYVFSV